MSGEAAGSAADAIAGLFNTVQAFGAIGGGISYADLISDRGQQYAGDMGELAGTLQDDSKFTGYGVRTGLGDSTVDQYGGINVGVGLEDKLSSATGKYHHGNLQMQNAYDMLQQGATNPYAAQSEAMMGQGYDQMANAFSNVPGREQEIYNRAMAMQQPMLDEARAQSNAREYAQGRGGVMGSQFGGTGEDQAMARAQAQAQNAASFQAMGQAQAEQMQQANLANMYGQQGLANAGMSSNIGQAYNQMGLGNMAQQTQAAATLGQLGYQKGNLGLAMQEASYLPMQNQLQALQVGQNNANLAQTGQLTGTGYGAQLGLGGIQTAVNADKASSELYGNLFGAMMSSKDGDGGLFDRIRQWI